VNIKTFWFWWTREATVYLIILPWILTFTSSVSNHFLANKRSYRSVQDVLGFITRFWVFHLVQMDRNRIDSWQLLKVRNGSPTDGLRVFFFSFASYQLLLLNRRAHTWTFLNLVYAVPFAREHRRPQHSRDGQVEKRWNQLLRIWTSTLSHEQLSASGYFPTSLAPGEGNRR
jgi:hypothetical protein